MTIKDPAGLHRKEDEWREPVPKPARPSYPGIKIRHIRMDELWDEAMKCAHEDGRSLSAVIRESLRRYVANHRRRSNGTGGSST